MKNGIVKNQNEILSEERKKKKKEVAERIEPEKLLI
jgi:hypothetical protein